MIYYIMYRGQSVGPMTAEQVVAYDVDRDTMVSADGAPWQPLFSYPELMEMLAARPKPAANQNNDSMRIACGILAIVIGGFGLQYFLVGKVWGGVINILLCLVTCGLWQFINIAQGIVILCMSDQDWRRKWVDSTTTFPVF